MTEEILTIETPEHVELHFALASIGNRFIACAIDHAVQVLLIIATVIAAMNFSSALRTAGSRAGASLEEGNLWLLAVATLAVFVLNFGYFVLFETLWNGQTPGKRLLRLRVIATDGRPVGFFAAFTRNLIRGADMMPVALFLPFYSIGVISVFSTPRSQRLGDLVAGTVVIKEREGVALRFDEVFSGEVIDPACRRIAPAFDFRADVRLLGQSEIEVVEAFLRRRYTIPDPARRRLAWRIAVPLLDRLRPDYDPAELDFESFLEELLARYRRLKKYSS
ncbi:MAG: RDD family protein [Acidobacteria bacterium]|nr:RDD family protein [Acidobacteriota bacterium]MCW5967399.1 RDD family protein [Blastocatellales bacterium]